jgi:hypothetical protein
MWFQLVSTTSWLRGAQSAEPPFHRHSSKWSMDNRKTFVKQEQLLSLGDVTEINTFQGYVVANEEGTLA